MIDYVIYTHKGWFGFCPVYVAELDKDAPTVDARHWTLEWLMTLSSLSFDLVFFIIYAINPFYDFHWPLLITGELNPPKLVSHG